MPALLKPKDMTPKEYLVKHGKQISFEEYRKFDKFGKPDLPVVMVIFNHEKDQIAHVCFKDWHLRLFDEIPNTCVSCVRTFWLVPMEILDG